MFKAARFNGFVVEHSAYDKTTSGFNFNKDADKMGTKALTTRQPPRVHAMIDMMSDFLPGASKAEIIYECIVLGFADFEKAIQTINPNLSEVVDAYCEGDPQCDEDIVQITAFDESFGEYFSKHRPQEGQDSEISQISEGEIK